MNELRQLKEQVLKLDDASIEKNGKYIYIIKDGKRTEFKAEINEETIKMTSAKELFVWILFNTLTCLK